MSFVLTFVNSVATSYFLNYFFFYLHDRFGFESRGNLFVAALHGGLYAIAAVYGGRFAERYGARTSLLAGFFGLTAAMSAGLAVSSRPGILLVLAAYTLSLLFIWPALEAMSTDVPAPAVPHRVGMYNLTWSAAAAFAYFTGGPLYDHLGPHAIFTLPALVCLTQGVYVFLVSPRRFTRREIDHAAAGHGPDTSALSASIAPATFLRLAWLANPFSYMAIYTLFAVMPDLAARLGLSPTRVGLFCSIWLFARLATFTALWSWTGWHYRFRWLVGAYLVLIVSFAGIVSAPGLTVLLIAQVGFGAAAGLIYYSSLFYSMDVGQTKAEHGGLHEAAIGIGICAGPAVGAATLQMFPNEPHAGVTGVTALLCCGLVALGRSWAKARTQAAGARR